MTGMRDAEKDRLALSVVDRHSQFEEALAGNRRKYPTREFRLFAEAVRRYVEKTGSDEMLHRDVVGAVHGLVNYLQIERKRYPAKCSSRPKDWSASFFSATIRTSMGTNLLVFEEACPVFAQSPFSRLSSRIDGGMGCSRQISLAAWEADELSFRFARHQYANSYRSFSADTDHAHESYFGTSVSKQRTAR